MSTVADASSATTFGRVPPAITPTLSDTPGATARSRCRSTIWAASSWTALEPWSGSTPACAATPCTLRRNSPHPFRAVLTAPPSRPGSSTNTASLWRASRSMTERELTLPRSSSDVHSMTIRPAQEVTSVRARAANMPIAMPPFMSSTPGPNRHPSRSSRGILSICSTGQTVSK